jgi:diguanylate cyclase (GGDEF)-like protein
VTLWERATTDGLTCLYNRTFAAQRMAEIRSLDVRQRHSTSVLIFDLDRFKLVNDRHGHAAGDLTLRAVAGAIRSVCRRADVTARWGGEEFLMVLPDTDTDTALLVAERVRATVERLIVPFESGEIRATVSVGSATAGIGDYRSMEAVLADADHALYEAKRSGRNRVAEWPPSTVRAA